ncbi:MAG: SusC/RagA family TonB-linked outer membrane protein [Bacteroidales bacterium]|nr:SusC/RagA family TonB-linked outer membrane protein [Bacteroidales bacterium]
MIKLLLSISFCLICYTSIAQQEISGTINSSEDGNPVPFVNIIGLQSKVGSSSDLDGKYRITIPENETHLVFSALGFRQDTILVSNRKMNVLLQSTMKQLEEVVVTALGIKREKKSIGYAITEVKGNDLKKTNEVSIINQLAGKVAGLEITSTNGGAGTSSRIILRGNNSITGDNQALIVVDGVPINNATSSNSGDTWGGRDYGNGVSDINPDDIESVSILKGASASALYGSQAMDGVILITTKKGKARKGIGVSFNTNTSIDMPYILYDLQNTYGAGRNGKFEGAWNIVEGIPVYNPENDLCKGSWGPKMEGQTIIDWDGQESSFSPQPDNYKNYFQNGITTNNSLGLDGGNEKFTYRFSVSDLRTRDIVPRATVNRTNLGLNLSGNILKNLKINTYINFIHQEAANRPGLSDAHDNPNRNYIHMPRNISTESLSNYYQDENGYEVTWKDDWGWMTNPFWNIEYQKNGDTRNRYFGNISLNYDFSPKLKLMLRTAPDYSNTEFSYIDAMNGLIYGLGRYGLSTEEHFLINSDLLFSYTEKISENFNFSLNLGGNSMYYSKNRINSHTEGGLIEPFIYTLENSKSPVYIHPYKVEAAKNSIYSFGQIGYKDFLYLDITGRNDWSSTLPKSHNSFFYPSFSLGFVFSELINEKFISKEILSFGKLRLSYAGVGNDADPYQLETTYEIIPDEGYGGMAFINQTVPNLGLLPELVNSFEVGTDIKLFMNRLGLDATYYDTRSHNQIAHMPVSATSGYRNAIINSGIIKNSGWEIQLNASPIKRPLFQWEMTLGYSKNKSEVIELAPNVDKVNLYEHWGLSIEARPNHPYGDIVGYGFLRDQDNNILIDDMGMVIRDETPKILGNFTPDFSLSLSNTFQIKNFTINSLLHARIGGEMFAGTNMYGYGYSGNFSQTIEGREEWYASEAQREEAGISPEDWIPTGGMLIEGIYKEGTIINGEDVSGQNNQTYVDPYQFYNRKVSLWTEEIHEPFIYDASFIKLRELSLSYKLPNKLVSKWKIKGATVGVYGKNLWLIYSKVPNIDPETMLTNGNGQGYELYSYPNRRSIGFSISVNL